MRALSYAVAAVLAAAAPSFAVDYPITEDSKPHEGVPKGEKLSCDFADSKIFPGTTRKVTVYIPRQYDPARPACVWVNQDGMQHKADVVFDNLIAKGEMPVTIYIAASPGVVKALDGKAALDRFNRSREYDGLGDAYARFVLEELLPFVEKQKTGDGRPIVLSKKGNDRCIGGSSSGAVCAFTAAWERPAEFRRVFSTIGTYVGLQGADVYPTLIRKYEPKGLRVFLQDGDHDQNIYGGDWWMANQMMEQALAFSGYEVNHAWGQEGHNAKQGDQIFPDAVRWIWKDWPKEPQVGKTGNAFLNEILIPGEGWEVVSTGEAWGLATDPTGAVVFQNRDGDVRVETNSQVGKAIKGVELVRHGNRFSQAFSPDGQRYALPRSNPNARMKAYSEDLSLFVINREGQPKAWAPSFEGSDFVVLPNGSAYVLSSEYENLRPGMLWLISPTGEKHPVDARRLNSPSAITISPDHSLLYVADAAGPFVHSFQIQPDGSLTNQQPYFHLHLPDTENGSGAAGMCVDSAGRLYVATTLGIQVCDQAGRVNCILPPPLPKTTAVTLGGANFDTLYAIGADPLYPSQQVVYRRKLKVKGVPAFAAPIKPAPPHL
jgi:gluconolactonase